MHECATGLRKRANIDEFQLIYRRCSLDDALAVFDAQFNKQFAQ